MPYTAMPEGGSELRLNPKTGAYEPPALDPSKAAELKAKEKSDKEAAKAAAEAQKQADAIEDAKWKEQKALAKKDLDAQEKAINDEEGPSAENKKTRIKTLRDAYIDEWAVRPKPVAPPPAAVPAPVAPVNSQAPLSTNVQLPPAPAQPFQPPTQPLNAGAVQLPGGPSQLAPPVKTLDQQWAESELSQIMNKMDMDGVTNIKHLPPAEQAAIDRLYKRARGY
jgi:hypothetical protein